MNINLTAPVGIYTSYQIASRNILKALHGRGHSVALFPIGELSGYSEDSEAINTARQNQTSYDRNAPSIRIWHQNDLSGHVGKSLHIGCPIFELDFFSPVELHHLKQQDALFVCSSWAKQVIKDNGIDVPTFVVPLGVDRTIFNEDVKPLLSKNKTLRLLSIGKFEFRKGHPELIECFNKAFTKSDDVELLLFWNNPFISPDDFDKIKTKVLDTPLGNKIRFLPFVNHPSELSQVIASCDCLVNPHRAEGWSIPLVDSLSMGLHVIASNYSAPTEYLTSKNALLIEPTTLEVASDGVWFKSGIGSWMTFGEPQKEQLISHMRFVHKQKIAGTLGVNMPGIMTAKRFSWNNTVAHLIDSLHQLGVN